jgi:hypothetical protein
MFEYTICDPLNPTVIDKGSITKEAFLEVLSQFPWQEMQKTMDAADDFEIYYSPSLGLTDVQSKHALEVSIVGEEFYIFYIRPKTVKKRKWFSSMEVFEPEYSTDRMGQDSRDVEDAFNALLDGNFELLESRWG